MSARVVPLGDQAFALRLEPVIDPEVNARVLAWMRALDQAAPPWLVDCVPGYAALVVTYDPTRAETPEVRAALERIAAATQAPPGTGGRLHRIPVLYDPEVGPDLDQVAAMRGLTREQVIALHTASEYRVYMLGFRPGFPFLGITDPRLEVPRLSSPRLSVEPGSVGLAGRQTGIYPMRSPGGWRIIGRTPARLFSPGETSPFLFQPGDRVRFQAIGPTEYAELLDAHRSER